MDKGTPTTSNQITFLTSSIADLLTPALKISELLWTNVCWVVPTCSFSEWISVCYSLVYVLSLHTVYVRDRQSLNQEYPQGSSTALGPANLHKREPSLGKQQLQVSFLTHSCHYHGRDSSAKAYILDACWKFQTAFIQRSPWNSLPRYLRMNQRS